MPVLIKSTFLFFLSMVIACSPPSGDGQADKLVKAKPEGPSDLQRRDRQKPKVPEPLAPFEPDLSLVSLPPIPELGTERYVPRWSYEKLEGWLVTFVLLPHSRETLFADLANKPNGKAIVLTVNRDWANLAYGARFTLLTEMEAREIAYLRANDELTRSEMFFRTAVPSRSSLIDIGWLLPVDADATAEGVAIEDVGLADNEGRSWHIGPFTVEQRVRKRYEGEMWIASDQVKPLLISKFEVPPPFGVGATPDDREVMDLGNPLHAPQLVAAFRFVTHKTLAMVVQESGYECSNYSVIKCTEAECEYLQEPRYSICAH